MTYFLLLAAALAVAGAGWAIRRRAAALGQGLIVLGCVGLLAGIGWQVRQNLFGGDAQQPKRAHAVVSFFLASQTQREISGQRGTVVLVFPPTSMLDAETAESYANAFRAPLLRGHPEWEIQIATLEASAKAARSGTIPLATFQQLVTKFPGALAFVCFAGVPAGLETLSLPGTKAPPWFLFDPAGGTNWLMALKLNRIRSVIVPRPDVNPEKAGGIAGMPGEIFSRLYYLATPENAEQIVANLGAKPTGSGR
jgi:hypothetical protein